MPLEAHYIFLGTVVSRKTRVTVPFKRGVLREVYVKDVIALIEEIKLEQDENGE